MRKETHTAGLLRASSRGRRSSSRHLGRRSAGLRRMDGQSTRISASAYSHTMPDDWMIRQKAMRNVDIPARRRGKMKDSMEVFLRHGALTPPPSGSVRLHMAETPGKRECGGCRGQRSLRKGRLPPPPGRGGNKILVAYPSASTIRNVPRRSARRHPPPAVGRQGDREATRRREKSVLPAAHNASRVTQG